MQTLEAVDDHWQENGPTPENNDCLMDCDPLYAGRVVGAIMVLCLLTGMSLCLILAPPLFMLWCFGLI